MMMRLLENIFEDIRDAWDEFVGSKPQRRRGSDGSYPSDPGYETPSPVPTPVGNKRARGKCSNYGSVEPVGWHNDLTRGRKLQWNEYGCRQDLGRGGWNRYGPCVNGAQTFKIFTVSDSTNYYNVYYAHLDTSTGQFPQTGSLIATGRGTIYFRIKGSITDANGVVWSDANGFDSLYSNGRVSSDQTGGWRIYVKTKNKGALGGYFTTSLQVPSTGGIHNYVYSLGKPSPIYNDGYIAGFRATINASINSRSTPIPGSKYKWEAKGSISIGANFWKQYTGYRQFVANRKTGIGDDRDFILGDGFTTTPPDPTISDPKGGWMGQPFQRSANCEVLDGCLWCDRDPFVYEGGGNSPGSGDFRTPPTPPTPPPPYDDTALREELADLEEQIEDILETIEEQELTLDEIEKETRKVAARARIEQFKPEYVGFNPNDLPRSVISVGPYGKVFCDRGIFFAPAGTNNPKWAGTKVGFFDLDSRNFRSCISPKGSLGSDNFYGFYQIPFVVNRGASYMQWTTLGSSNNSVSTYTSDALSPLTVSYDDDAGTVSRPPHPLDHIYSVKVSNKILSFRHLTYHTVNRFFKAVINPSSFYEDHWATLLADGPVDGTWGRNYFPADNKCGFRCKDMYLSNPSLKDHQNINDTYPVSLERYTVDKLLLPNSKYSGEAASMLRIMPGIPISEQTAVDADDRSPEVIALHSDKGGGAYYVQAVYPDPTLGNFDISMRLNPDAYRASNKGLAFHGKYHHDMVDVDDAHNRPSTFIYACLKNAGLEPSFYQDGIADDDGLGGVDGPLNSHKMQLIESTDVTYAALIRRVLPALGYVVRINPGSLRADLVDIGTRKWPKLQMGDNMIQLLNISYNIGEQYSSYIFENKDMLRGDNTLEEWKNSPHDQGRYTVINSNPFLTGRTITIATGTWTAEWETVADMMTLRKDLYSWRVSNYALINEETNRFESPLIGDTIRLRSQKVPVAAGFVDVLIVGRTQTEEYTEYQGYAFEGAGPDTGETPP